MRRLSRSLTTLVIISICAFAITKAFFQSTASNLAEASSNSDQLRNFNDDLNNAGNYWAHNNLAFDFAENGQYEKAVDEYKTAIEVIEKMPGDKWPNLKKEDADRINQQTRIDAQIFSRYGLIEALESTGRYDEAIQNVEWLQKNQVMKTKEELLRKKLEGMKKNLLQKMKANFTGKPLETKQTQDLPK